MMKGIKEKILPALPDNQSSTFGHMSENCLNLNVWTPSVSTDGSGALFFVLILHRES
jgi:carboxylesterase type B